MWLAVDVLGAQQQMMNGAKHTHRMRVQVIIIAEDQNQNLFCPSLCSI